MRLETDNLLISQYQLDDLAELRTILSDPRTMSFWPAPLTSDQVRDWLTRSLTSYATVGFGRYAVRLQPERVLIGDCGILRATVAGAEVNDLAYLIHHPYWSNGYATEAAAAVKEYAFTQLGLTELAANMAYDNVASQRVAEKLGMKKVAEFSNERNRGIKTLLYRVKADES